eukprot:gene24849-32366_t
MRRCATFADESVLNNYNCFRSEELKEVTESNSLPGKLEHDRLSGDKLDVFRNGSWTIKSFHSNILNEHETLTMTKELKAYIAKKYSSLQHLVDAEASTEDSICINGQKLHTPPMLFGRDILKLKFGEVEISVNPCHAIFCWAEKHTEENIQSHPYRPIRVPFSKNWLEKQELPGSIRSAVVFDAKGTEGPTALDWTYSSDYCFTIGATTISGQQMTEEIVTAYNVLQQDNADSRWSISASESSGIDYAMLRQQDLPILFYDECLLYQDDLEDCGEVDFEAKLRVMPNCWFLLNKMYLRVDGAILRSRETRLFHRFQPAESQGEKAVIQVHGEITWREFAQSE